MSDDEDRDNKSSMINTYSLCNNPNVLLRLFRHLDDKAKANQLKIDHDSIYYITPKEYANKISHIIINHMANMCIKPGNIIITDTTAGVGGDTIAFASMFNHVYAIELNELRATYLKNNISVYDLDNVSVINDSCLTVLPTITNHNVVYIDPPWGGRSYKKYKVINELHIGETSIEDLCNNILSSNMSCIPRAIVLKLPTNYNILNVYNKVNSSKIYLHELKKMSIIVIINTNKLNIGG